MYYQILIKDAFQELAPRLLSFILLLPSPSFEADPNSWGAQLARGQQLVFCLGWGANSRLVAPASHLPEPAVKTRAVGDR